MSCIVFENKGEIDIRTIKTFGVSIKETNQAIGFFGTGMKYAIAILLREGSELIVQSGEKSHTFEKKIDTIRGQEVELLFMDGEQLPFTSHLGVNWEMWQAFREIYCNCLDEGGKVSKKKSVPTAEADVTRFIVTGRAFSDCYNDRNSIVLDLPESICETVDGLEIYNRPSRHLYYRGIRVYDLNEPSKMTYNMTEKTTLTEDRTVRNLPVFFDKIFHGTANLKNKKWIKKILLSTNESFEGAFSFFALQYNWNNASEEFDQVVGEYYRMNSDKCNRTALGYYAEKMKQQGIKDFVFVDPDALEKKMIERSMMVGSKLFQSFDKYPVRVVENLGEATMALADDENNQIVLSRKCFTFGTKFVASTIIEEWMHLETGFSDHTRELQTHLFDTICTITERHVLMEPI